MIESGLQTKNKARLNGKPQNNKSVFSQVKRLSMMCKVATNIIGRLYNPIDATNRFINLALQNLEEDSQSRQFLIESKEGIRKTSILLKKLNNYTKKIKKEIGSIPTDDE